VEIYPAIDIKGGRVVRRRDVPDASETVYGGDPRAQAELYAAAGARWLHVVDIDRAFRTGGDNTEWVRRICDVESVAVQLGGNLASLEDVKRALDAGVSRVVLGTQAALDPALLEQLVGAAGAAHAAVAIDVREGRVALRGVSEPLSATPAELARQLSTGGVTTVVYRDLDRDGGLAGADLQGAATVSEQGLDVIVAGGVAGLDDVRGALALGLAGVIVGRALYEQKLVLEEALACCGSAS
jgi:phosphoribosylformimino-5-aminoimidazole carboxamide ribotide isomerase